MNIEQLIKIQMIKSGVKTDSELARRCGWARANLSDRFKRDSWKISDLEKIADALDCDLSVEFVERN